MEETEFLVIFVYLLASIPRKILTLIISGNLCSASRSDEEIHHLLKDPDSLWRTRAGEKNAPGIYIRNLVDKDGDTPTPNQYLWVPKRLRNYVSSESCRASRSDEDLHHFLHDPESTWRIRAGEKNAPGIYIRNLVDKDGDTPTPNQYLRVPKRLRNYVSGESCR
ncbi:uncharacterized protein J4E79_008591 [Alternaria viburni]|uniref:uncharacterized protein n=1 Tax=Alternaria viburni TaxID=566460 RepID=UPI0020C2B219|nr:uncharacterized protein J4E79_008591 [Alternaria viburni]KAI4653078.1 hypothetical protein J4E79_008591 [Alternaria viburni]